MKFVFAIHIPLFRGEDISVTVGYMKGKTLDVIIFREVPERDFHDGVMPYIARVAGEIAQLVKQAWIDCYLIFSGRGYQPEGYHTLLAGRWPAQSYSLVTVTNAGADTSALDKLEGSGADPGLGYPCNHFVVPRISIIGALNLGYTQPGLMIISAAERERDKVTGQLAEFAERANRISANDPEALLEYQGEGLVMSWGVLVWHEFRADVLRNKWGARWRQSNPQNALAST